MLSFNHGKCVLKRNVLDGCTVVVQVRALVRKEQNRVCVHRLMLKFSFFFFFLVKVGQSQVIIGYSFT